MTAWTPSQDWLDARFKELVLPDVFANAQPHPQPTVVLLGAQPGAGKSSATHVAQNLHDHALVEISGDNFRSLHPDYEQLQRDDPEAMPQVTQAVSGPLVRRCIDYARDHHIPILLEGTFRDPQMVTSTAQQFRDAGYQVHVLALGVPRELSRASAIDRYITTLGTEQNRWTPMTAHEAAVRAIPDTLHQLGESPSVDRITIANRDGHILEDSSTPGVDRAQQMSQRAAYELTRSLTPAEQRIVDDVRHRVAQLDPATRTAIANNIMRATRTQPITRQEPLIDKLRREVVNKPPSRQEPDRDRSTDRGRER